MDFVMLLLVVLVVVTIMSGVRIVPQGEEWIVERLGRFQRLLLPGLSVIIPYVDRIAYKVPTKDLILDIERQEVITMDNAVLITNAVTFVKVTEPERAVYGIADYRRAVAYLTQTSLRSIIGGMDLNEALSSRERIKTLLKDSISAEVADWGMTIKTVEIQDIKPSPTMQMAMEQQAAAERSRKAAVTTAQGEKEAAILSSEGRLESAKNDARAQVELAHAAREALEAVASAVPDKNLAPLYLLGQRYVESMQGLAASGNSKIVVLPADLQQSLAGLLGRVAKG